jgi:ParB-like chromosome segregation protein Spo0J
MGFEPEGVKLDIRFIKPLRRVADAVKLTPKYRQILTSIREVGVIEPPIVSRDHDTANEFLLLDGHLRLEALKDLGETEVVCLISTDDEGFTYNKRVNRIAIIQEHRMILKAIERGASEERIAKALNVDVAHNRRHRIGI